MASLGEVAGEVVRKGGILDKHAQSYTDSEVVNRMHPLKSFEVDVFGAPGAKKSFVGS